MAALQRTPERPAVPVEAVPVSPTAVPLTWADRHFTTSATHCRRIEDALQTHCRRIEDALQTHCRRIADALQTHCRRSPAAPCPCQCWAQAEHPNHRSPTTRGDRGARGGVEFGSVTDASVKRPVQNPKGVAPLIHSEINCTTQAKQDGSLRLAEIISCHTAGGHWCATARLI